MIIKWTQIYPLPLFFLISISASLDRLTFYANNLIEVPFNKLFFLFSLWITISINIDTFWFLYISAPVLPFTLIKWILLTTPRLIFIKRMIHREGNENLFWLKEDYSFKEPNNFWLRSPWITLDNSLYHFLIHLPVSVLSSITFSLIHLQVISPLLILR